jgi:hypothetical protein
VVDLAAGAARDLRLQVALVVMVAMVTTLAPQSQAPMGLRRLRIAAQAAAAAGRVVKALLVVALLA